MASWYYARDGQQFGPVELPELQRLAAAGTIRAADLVWAEGMTEWRSAGDVPAVFATAAPAPAGYAASPYDDRGYAPHQAYAPGAYPQPGGYPAPAAAPQGYQAAYPPQYAQPSGKYATLAMVAVILGGTSFVVGGPLTGIAGLVCGWIALAGMKRTGESQNRGLAVAAIAIGVLWVVLMIALILFIMFVIANTPQR